MEKPSSSSSAIRSFGSDKDERKRPTLEEETIIKLTPRWLQEALKTAFSGILKHEDNKRLAFKSMIIASNKDRRIVLKKSVLSNVTEKHNRHEIADRLGFCRLPTSSNRMSPSELKMEPPTSKTMEMESYTSNTMSPSELKMEPSTSKTMEMESYTFTTVSSTSKMDQKKREKPPSKMESCTSTTVKPSMSSELFRSLGWDELRSSREWTSVKPSTPIPEAFEWIRAVSTVEEREKVIGWARSKANEIQLTDPSEMMRLLMWAEFLFTKIVQFPGPERSRSFLRWGLSTSTKEAPDERKRLLKWAHSTARVAAPDERKRWSLQEEILKPFETALEHIQSEMNKYGVKYGDLNAKKHSCPKHKDSYPHVNQEHIIYTFKGKHGRYECRNALWIWTKYLRFYGIPLRQLHRGPVYFGEKIKDNFPDSDMIEGRPSVNELGFVTIELSGKWIAKSIHKMLIDGLHTWAPKFPVKKVILYQSPLGNRTRFDAARGIAIKETQTRILMFSNVDVRGSSAPFFFQRIHKALQPDNKRFPFEEREASVVIKGQIPFILPKRHFKRVYDDIPYFWHVLHNKKADWIISIAPVWQHVYHEMYLAAGELEKWIPIDGHKTTRTSFAGYQIGKLTAVADDLCFKAPDRLGVATRFVGYSAEAIVECAHKYTSLKNHRLSYCMFNIDEMLNEEGNTLVYLLNTRAELRRITDDYRVDINEVKKASELKLEKDIGWEKGEERILGLHLLEFTEALEESCLSVLPHILCEYVYDLSKKFNEYHSSVCKDGFVVDTSTLLLYEATAVVMEQCFQLLGIDPQCIPPTDFFTMSVAQLPKYIHVPVEDLGAILRDPHRNSRFQPFSFCIRPMTLRCEKDSKLFGLISASDKHGLPHGSHCSKTDFQGFFEPDFTYVPIFNHDWLNPVDMTDGELVYLQSPAFQLSSFSSFISVQMELYVTKKKECHQVCNQNKVIDLSDFYGKKLDAECGCLSVDVEQGSTRMYYILLKDAVDTSIDVEFKMATNFLREVAGYVVAYYGDEFLYDNESVPAKDCYFALLFLPKPPYSLQASTLPLIKSQLAVPTTGSLIVKAYFEDFYSGEVILNNSCKFKPQKSGCKDDTIIGSKGCSLKVNVVWDPEKSYYPKESYHVGIDEINQE